MALLKASEPWAMTADQAAQRQGYASRSELALRKAAESFCRERWPEARIVHEIVMGEGRVRADVAALGTSHIAALEIKGEYDNMTRMLHQVGMYQLCVPEVWMVVPYGKHADDCKLIRHLLPSVGLLIGNGTKVWEDGPRTKARDIEHPEFALVVDSEPVPRQPVTKLMLEMCWAAELVGICDRTRTSVGKKATRPHMIAALMDLGADVLQAEVCTALRSRDALWRADAPISATAHPSSAVSPQNRPDGAP